MSEQWKTRMNEKDEDRPWTYPKVGGTGRGSSNLPEGEGVTEPPLVAPRYTSSDVTLVGPDGFTRLAPVRMAEREALRSRLASWFGDDRQAFLVSHLAPVVERIVADRLAEAEFHVEQLRDACDSAERSLERIEARAVELATERDAALARIAMAERLIDSWEHDAPDHSNPVFIGRLRERLRRDPAPVRLRGEERCVVCSRLAPLHGGLCCFHKYDEQPLCIHCASDEDPACEHEWLDRPESDTRECLICGTEVAG